MKTTKIHSNYLIPYDYIKELLSELKSIEEKKDSEKEEFNKEGLSDKENNIYNIKRGNLNEN